jgi:hypothetical protein
VTADARIVTRVFQIGRRTLTPVARRAFEFFMFGDLVREGLERAVTRTHRDRGGRFGRGDRDRQFFLLADTAHRKRDNRAENDEGL